MKTIEVCVGSSCHLKGAYDVVDRLTRLIEEQDLGSQVRVVGSFCLDACQRGVAVRVGETIHSARTAEDADRILCAALED